MEFWADCTLTVLGLGVLGATIWAMQAHFTSTEMLPRAKLIAGFVVFNTLVLLVLTWVMEQPLAAQIVGMIIIAGSAWLFFAAIDTSKEAKLRFAFDPEKPSTLLEAGPYGWVRHPFYVSYILLWLGWAIATWSLWTVPLFVILYALYFSAAQMEESNFADTPMAGAYAEYKRRVGFFWPKLPSGQRAAS